MSTVQIPNSIDEAATRLTTLDAIARATGWERAAIVAAFVRLDFKPGPRSATSSRSPVEFAALGIAGLRSKDTVRRYVEIWLEAHNGEHPPVGCKVTLPTVPWPPEERNTGSRTTTSNIGDQIRANTALAEAAATAIVDVIANLPETIVSDLFRVIHNRLTAGMKVGPRPTPEMSINDEWKAWMYDQNQVFIDGARLAERTDAEGAELDAYGAAARLIYDRITERKLDAEIRQFLEGAEVEQ